MCSGNRSDLPLYKSNATDNEKKQKLQWMYDQLKLIKTQENDQIPVSRINIRCGCFKLVNYLHMYRCLYCEVFYCKECAEQHFGYRVD